MLTIKTLYDLNPEDVEACVEALRGGEMILYPTETFYAIGIDPWNQSARRKLYELKGREASKELPCIASNAEMVKGFCRTDHPAFVKLAKRFWPGPLTLILPLRDQPSSIAVRVSSHRIAREISKRFGAFVVSTSANRSNEPSISEVSALPRGFDEFIAVAVDNGPTAGGLPSTIVSLLETEPAVIRPGAIPADQIRASL